MSEQKRVLYAAMKDFQQQTATLQQQNDRLQEMTTTMRHEVADLKSINADAIQMREDLGQALRQVECLESRVRVQNEEAHCKEQVINLQIEQLADAVRKGDVVVIVDAL